MKELSFSEELRTQPVTSCAFCGAAFKPLYRQMPDRLFGVEGMWNLVKCARPSCGMVWQNPMIIPADIPGAYRNYYTHPGHGDVPSETSDFINRSNRASIGKCIARIMGKRRESADSLHMYLLEKKPGRLLDVGCGDGRFLHRMKQRGWDVEGVDIDPVAAEGVRKRFGINVTEGLLAEVDLPPNSFDAITMSHVIEHAPLPLELFRECSRLLRSGGIFIVTTPNCESLGARIFGPAWVGWDQPRHLNLFSLRTLRACAKQTGFTAIEVWSTAVNAAYFIRASIEIVARQHHCMAGGTAGFATRVSGKLGQSTEKFLSMFSGSVGEEVVLRCKKN